MLFATKVLSHLLVKVSPYHKWSVWSGNTVLFCEDFENFFTINIHKGMADLVYIGYSTSIGLTCFSHFRMLLEWGMQFKSFEQDSAPICVQDFLAVWLVYCRRIERNLYDCVIKRASGISLECKVILKRSSCEGSTICMNQFGDGLECNDDCCGLPAA